jgi:hypothetical protein
VKIGERPIMKKVFKYELPSHACDVQMPAGAEIVHVGEQRGQVCLWAVVDPDATAVTRRFVTVGTGWEIERPESLKHLASIVMEGHALVWHVFERIL